MISVEEDAQPNFVDFDQVDDEMSLGEDRYQVNDDFQQWDTNAWTRDTQDVGSVGGVSASCLGTAGTPPESGTFILGSVDGVCQWIDTTDCS